MSYPDFVKPQQAAAIPIRRRGDDLQVCLIRKRLAGSWGIPKGTVDSGETHESTALNEAWEEAGLRGRLVGDSLGTYKYKKYRACPDGHGVRDGSARASQGLDRSGHSRTQVGIEGRGSRASHRAPGSWFSQPCTAVVPGGRMTIRILAAAVAALSLGQASPPPDLILHNARIYTVDASRPTAEAIAIRGDRIARVGANSEVLALRGSATRVIDVSGRTIVPGLQDAHGHFTGLGASMQSIDLRGTTTYEQVVGMVRQRAATARPGEWIVGRGWDQNDWPEKQWPTHELLSAASPNNPGVPDACRWPCGSGESARAEPGRHQRRRQRIPPAGV